MQDVLNVKKKKRLDTKVLVRISLLSVISYLLMFIHGPLPIFPAFLKLDVAELPALIGGFSMGPLAGVAIVLIKNILHFVTKTSTGGVGELSNFIVGSAYVLTASLIYLKYKTRFGAILGMLLGTIMMAVTGAISNYYLIIPFYSNFMPIEQIVALGSAVNKHIVDVQTLILYGITPFNIVKGLSNSILTLVMYKSVSRLLK
ncbi:Riboflavin transporter FmnP [Anaerobranca californiensis DSM 14826]|uniref:Riboflavin transporter n=1 Tax=Anaerobranca californiensis DSM 14826 TaxID=1120989 RepID=A0A1M6RVV4_9FIRM|nr:ECF transporter S component [Anaerobranca californiensis]SHK36601.1 Riboflavin transporter FmnP [Anaerobranca californiensis DSM 14826]